MYMMKLKNDKFGSEAGACWRQLFVVALMPWLMKLRVFSDKRLAESLVAAYNAQRLELPFASAHAKDMDDTDSHEPEYPSLVDLAENPRHERKKKKRHKSKSKRHMSKSDSKRLEEETELATDEPADGQPSYAREIFEEETELPTDQVAENEGNEKKREKRKSKSKSHVRKSASNQSSNEVARSRSRTRASQRRATSSMN
jgi:hypothetical protein